MKLSKPLKLPIKRPADNVIRKGFVLPKPIVKIRLPISKQSMRESAAAKVEQLDRKAEARKRYRTDHNVEMHNCLGFLAELEKHARTQVVTFPNGRVREIPAFVPTATGEVLDTTGVTITRWLKKGMLPQPELATSRGKVWHIEEVRSFVKIIGEHQQQYRQYRAEHIDITDAIFRENRLLRQSLFSPK